MNGPDRSAKQSNPEGSLPIEAKGTKLPALGNGYDCFCAAAEPCAPINKKGDNILEYLKAFVIGGALCAIGQIFIDKTKLTPARILVGFVVAGVALSALGFYEPFVDFAGAGATVPLSGFGHLLAKGVRAAVNDYGILGAFTGGISAAAGGITAAIVFAFAAALLFKPKDK